VGASFSRPHPPYTMGLPRAPESRKQKFFIFCCEKGATTFFVVWLQSRNRVVRLLISGVPGLCGSVKVRQEWLPAEGGESPPHFTTL